MRFFHSHVYTLLTVNISLLCIALLFFWPLLPAIKFALIYTLLLFLPGLSIAQNFSLTWMEHFALAHVLGMTFPLIYAVWNILGFRLNGAVYIIVPLLVLIAGVYRYGSTMH